MFVFDLQLKVMKAAKLKRNLKSSNQKSNIPQHSTSVAGCSRSSIYLWLMVSILLGYISAVLFGDIYLRSFSKLQTNKATFQKFSDVDAGEEYVRQLASSTPAKGFLEATKVSTKNLKFLFMTATYTMDQFLYLQKVLDCMRDLCNGGINVTVHLQVASEFDYSDPRWWMMM